MKPRRAWLVALGAAALYGSETPVTFNKHIAPILFEFCAPCHRPGEAAPFSLLTYADARMRARQIAAVTANRYMPPWPPEPGKGDFEGARRLSAEQIQLLARWAAGGTPRGNAADLPAAPKFAEGWQMGTPDLVITMDEPYTLAAGGSDVFRNFVLRVPVDRRRYVRGLEIRPGNKRVVHHANVLVDRTGSARARNREDGFPGFPGMDVKLETEGFEPDSHFLFWKPGTVYQPEPAGMSWMVEPGTDLVLNMHLQPSGKAETLRPSIGLYFTDKPPALRPMLVQLEHDGALDIPPGDRSFTVTDELRLPVDVEILGIYPHAHYLGKDIEAKATLPDGTTRWLIHIPDWDINWQAVYRYRKPVALPKGTVISMRYTYDNSADNPRNPSHPPVRVAGGDRSVDEMGHLWLQVLVREGGDNPRIALQEALMRRRLEKYPADFLAHYTLAAIAQSRGSSAEAADLFRAALKARPQDASAHNGLGVALHAMGRFADAVREFETAIAVRPAYIPAHHNLGKLQLMAGDYQRAIPHLERAAEDNPRDAGALSDLGAALHAAGRSNDAVRALRRAVEIAPGMLNVRYNLGQALSATGDLAGAEDQLRAASRLDPADADTHAALGLVLAGRGQTEEAQRELSEALRLDPKHEDARKAIEQLKKNGR